MSDTPQIPEPEEVPKEVPRKRRPRGCAGVFFCVMLILASVWGAALGIFVWVVEDAKTTIAALDDFRPKVGSKVYSADGELLGEFTLEARQLVSLNEIPLDLQRAFLASEDHKFYEHAGVRPLSIASAVFDSLRSNRRLRGASTITQQTVRNIDRTEVGREVTMQRKIREAIISLQLEREFTKDEILELYLNQIFLGVSAHGVEGAAQQYFGKHCRDLTLGESAMIAGLTPAPNDFEPFSYPDEAIKRRDLTLRRMVEVGFITKQEQLEAMAEDLHAQVVSPSERAEKMARGEGLWRPNRFKAPYFSEDVRRFLLKPPAGYELDATKEDIFEAGLEIRTTVDMRLQRAAEKALLGALDAFDEKKLAALKRQGREHEFYPVSGALVCIDNGYRNPEEAGFVRAMVGGRDFTRDKFNRATQALRQPGSSIKPFVWAAAIDSGLTPSTIEYDSPYYRPNWAPKNFDGKFSGPVTLRRALERSVNIVSIKLTDRVGMSRVRSYYQNAGITTPIPDYVGTTIALGTPEVYVIDQCAAYATFAMGGTYVKPIMITDVIDRDGFRRYDHRNFIRRERAFRESLAYVMTYLMEGVTRYGTGTRTNPLERPCAGKTGTSNDAKDVWFCGYTPQYTCVIWVGYDHPRPLGSGLDYTGGRLATPIWTEFMIAAHEGLPVASFQAPHGVEFIPVSRESGRAGGNFPEAFIDGKRPPVAPPPPPDPVYAAEGESEPISLDFIHLDQDLLNPF
jgi:penicillin-binding protein 1A